VTVQWAHSSVSLIDETSQVGAAWPVCRLFNCSIGFHSGSGESFFFISCSQVSALTWFFVVCLLQENHLKIIPFAVPSPIVTSKSKPAGVTREFQIIFLCFALLH
jgi:hypothetical protein